MAGLSRWLKKTALVAVASLLAGCGTPSVHGIVTADNEIPDERIVGSWREEGEKKDTTTYTVTAAKEGYRLHVASRPAEKDEKPVDTDLELHLVRLGAHTFIDVTASDAERSRIGEKHSTLFIPTHLLARVEVLPDRLNVWYLKQDWVRQAITDRSISGTPLDDTEHGPILITSETPRLQAFLKTNAENVEAWEQVTLRRIKDTPVR